MRTSFYCLFSLLCAVPVLCEKYHIHSDIPGCFIFSDGTEKPGDLVKTVPKVKKGFPPYTVVNIDPPICPTEPSKGVISCLGGGLFIGLNEDCNKLEWKTEPYNWTINPGLHPFHIITVPEEGKIWFDNVYDKGVVEVVKDPGPEGACWKIDKA